MKSALPAFIGSLQKRGLVDLNILGNGEEHFNNRLKLQKYVYLARYYGLDMQYNYSRYLHGPYSRELAEDYYTLAEHPQSFTGTSHLDIRDEFFDLISNKDTIWLEAGSTLLSLRESFTDRESLLDRAANMKAHIPIDTLDSVLRDLERAKLISF